MLNVQSGFAAGMAILTRYRPGTPTETTAGFPKTRAGLLGFIKELDVADIRDVPLTD